MIKTQKTFAVVVALAIGLLPGVSEARFGKRSDNDGDNNSKKSHNARPAAVHQARPATGGSGHSYSPPPQHHGHTYYAPAPVRVHTHVAPVVVYDPVPAPVVVTPPYVAMYTPPPPPVVVVESPQQNQQQQQSTNIADGHLSAFGMGFTEGGAAGLELRLEGKRLGISGELTAIGVASDSMQSTVDMLSVGDLHLTYSFLSGDRGRARVEFGFNSVFAEDLTVLGPDAGISGQLRLVGPVGIEGAAYLTAWPHRRLETTLAGTLAIGPIGVKGGWRQYYLDDAGLVDGVQHTDFFGGPYVGVGFVF